MDRHELKKLRPEEQREVLVKEEREKELLSVNEELSKFNDSEFVNGWVNNRKSSLLEKINKRPDKQPKFKGNITMKQKLEQLYNELDKEPQKTVSRVISRLEQSKQSLEVELSANRN